MDGQGGQGASSSSDFVSHPTQDTLPKFATNCLRNSRFANSTSESQPTKRPPSAQRLIKKLGRMLESPSDESVVRWGNEGDSFVVLEVRIHEYSFITAP